MPNCSVVGERIETVLAALYLRGGPRPAELPRRGWPSVLAALRRETNADPVELLRRTGMTMPATVLNTAGLLAWAESMVAKGAVLTADSESYPARWLETMGDAAPPALWRRGVLRQTPWLGAVGSRAVSSEADAFMRGIGDAAVGTGRGIVSGGATGCDSVAERAALRSGGVVLRILPHGLELRHDEDDAVCVSLAAPQEPFSRPLAMERNALIYAAADATVVGQARMRGGGTWHGATDALRRRLGRVLMRNDGSAAAQALLALGAEPLDSPDELALLLQKSPPQRNLFAYERRRRRTYRA